MSTSTSCSPKINDKGRGCSFSHHLPLLNFPSEREAHCSFQRATLRAHMVSRSKRYKRHKWWKWFSHVPPSGKVLLPSCEECGQQTPTSDWLCLFLQGLPHLRVCISWATYTRWLRARQGLMVQSLLPELTQGHSGRSLTPELPMGWPRLWQSCIVVRLLSLLIPAPSPFLSLEFIANKYFAPASQLLSHVCFRRTQTVTAFLLSQIYFTNVSESSPIVGARERVLILKRCFCTERIRLDQSTASAW